MLSLRNVSAQQAKHYYKREDRTSRGRSLAKSETSSLDTTWFGNGADRLSLSLEIEPADFQKILEGVSPAGEPLSARKIDLETRRAATDFTFSAPKSVSIAALVQGDRRVVEAHDQAVRSVLSEMEEQFSQTRVRTEQGQIKVGTDNLLVGIFRHETSREQDPQLHSHALVMNCTQLSNGQWRSLSNELIVHHSKFLGQIYQNELAHQLSECGYEIEQRSNGQFELKGYAELRETFSTRRQQIEEHLKPLESPTLKQREHAALTTRQAKVQIDTEVLSQRWEEKLVSLDESVPEIPEPGQRTDLTRLVSQMAIAHFDERSNVFRSGAAEQYLVENFTGQTSLANLRNALREEAVVVDELTGLLMSERSLVQELDSIQMMETGKSAAINDLSDLNEPFQFEQMAAEQLSLAQLNEAIAANFALHDQVMSWQRSGKGKNGDRLKWYQELAEQAGYSVKGYAPSLETAQWLAEDVGMETAPIATLFNQQTEPQSKDLDEEPELEIWVIDQAAGLSSEAMNALLQQAQENQVRLILIEEPQQSSVKIAGNAFQALQQAGMQTVEGFGASLETLHALSLASQKAFKNDPELGVELEQPTNAESQTVEVGAVSLEPHNGFSFEQEETFESSLPLVVENNRSLSLEENQLASVEPSEVVTELTASLEPEPENWAEVEVIPSGVQPHEEATQAEWIEQLMQTTMQYFNTQLYRGEVSAIENNLAVTETTDYWVVHHHDPESRQPLKLQVQDKATNTPTFEIVWQDDPCSICEAARWEVETIAPEAREWLEQAEQTLVVIEKHERAKFVAQLTDTTMDFFNNRLSQGEIVEINSNVAAVESPDYWLVYHHNQESGEPPALQVQDKATNSVVFESRQREEGWQPGIVKPEAEAWLEQASRELAADQERIPQIRQPQMEM
jgi:conjugative relaxase-like TrwC/TraI family protein